jgi:uncharacterized protein (UPF0332 family)/predicted nucleotidyltransferase
MTKKKKQNTQEKPKAETAPKTFEDLPKETQEKLHNLKSKLETFQQRITDKFKQYIMGVSLLPPNQEAKTKEEKERINTLVLIDDTESNKLSKDQLKEKLSKIIIEIGKDVDKNITPEIVLLTEVWQSCYDGKNELLQMIAISSPIYDTGMLSAIKIAEIHKSMVIKKFEKYIVSYVLAGSLTQGKATATSDIDVWIVIDDTDVKKMTRVELKDKLRAIIMGMGLEAGEMTGIKNKLNIQVYILTDFWDSLKEANPVIFTLLRDGIPFYDRGIFMPWKNLLAMGKIKPSPEAIDMFMNSGEQMLQRVNLKIKEIGMEDTYWAILTPSQAALMLYGIPPPTPRETPELMSEIFVKKEKLLEEKYVKILKDNIQVRKELEHGSKKEITGKEIDELLKNAHSYLKRIKELFREIETRKQEEGIVHIYDTTTSLLRDAMKLEGIEKVTDTKILKVFEDEMVCSGKIPNKFLRILENIFKAKKDYDTKKITKTEVEKTRKDANEFARFIIEHIQRKRGNELEKAKIRVKHGKKYGEVILLKNKAFIIHDLDKAEKEISTANITKDGNFSNIQKSTIEDLEKAITEEELQSKVFIKEKIFENLKTIFGKDIEILIN